MWRPRALLACNLIIISLGQPPPRVPRDLLQPARIEFDIRFVVYLIVCWFLRGCIVCIARVECACMCWRSHLVGGDRIVQCCFACLIILRIDEGMII